MVDGMLADGGRLIELSERDMNLRMAPPAIFPPAPTIAPPPGAAAMLRRPPSPLPPQGTAVRGAPCAASPFAVSVQGGAK
ncbi:hypothetical protein SAMN05518801_101366 [Novosphingobium sp. CF614]|nr:hypothetical protein SAMN05518801_101366 [Novosphingobium sp. CF614]